MLCIANRKLCQPVTQITGAGEQVHSTRAPDASKQTKIITLRDTCQRCPIAWNKSNSWIESFLTDLVKREVCCVKAMKISKLLCVDYDETVALCFLQICLLSQETGIHTVIRSACWRAWQEQLYPEFLLAWWWSTRLPLNPVIEKARERDRLDI